MRRTPARDAKRSGTRLAALPGRVLEHERPVRPEAPHRCRDGLVGARRGRKHDRVVARGPGEHLADPTGGRARGDDVDSRRPFRPGRVRRRGEDPRAHEHSAGPVRERLARVPAQPRRPPGRIAREACSRTSGSRSGRSIGVESGRLSAPMIRIATGAGSLQVEPHEPLRRRGAPQARSEAGEATPVGAAPDLRLLERRVGVRVDLEEPKHPIQRWLGVLAEIVLLDDEHVRGREEPQILLDLFGVAARRDVLVARFVGVAQRLDRGTALDAPGRRARCSG